MLHPNWVWTFNKALPELTNTDNNINNAVQNYHSLLLKEIVDDIYYELNISMDVINFIIKYNEGDLVYNYSKRFEQFTKNTVYITPIIFGYIESFLFILMFIVSMFNAEYLISIISSFYAAISIIHGICALISYHKCKNYEMIIRNFIDPNIIPNPYSNNQFAYISYQRWCNVKFLKQLKKKDLEVLYSVVPIDEYAVQQLREYDGKSFTPSKSALCLIKYWFLSSYIIYAMLFIYTPKILSICWGIIVIHSYYVFFYCCCRVFGEKSYKTHRSALSMALILAVCFDIVIGISIGLSLNNAYDNKRQKLETWEIDMIIGVFVICCLLCLSFIVRILHGIIRYNENVYIYAFWFIWFLFGLYWFMAWVIVEYDTTAKLLAIISWRSSLMLIAAYLVLQQLTHQVMTGMNRTDYIKNYIACNPQIWLKNELKLLFIPYIKSYQGSNKNDNKNDNMPV